MNYLQFLLVKYYMDNPDMSNDIDDKPSESRYRHYYKYVTNLTLAELIEELREAGEIDYVTRNTWVYEL